MASKKLVQFICNNCKEVLKIDKIKTHLKEGQDKGCNSVTCNTCHKDLGSKNYKNHNCALTLPESGDARPAKVRRQVEDSSSDNKETITWLTLLERVAGRKDKKKSKGEQKLLDFLVKCKTAPRTETSFQNFVKNSCKIYASYADSVWNMLQEERAFVNLKPRKIKGKKRNKSRNVTENSETNKQVNPKKQTSTKDQVNWIKLEETHEGKRKKLKRNKENGGIINSESKTPEKQKQKSIPVNQTKSQIKTGDQSLNKDKRKMESEAQSEPAKKKKKISKDINPKHELTNNVKWNVEAKQKMENLESKPVMEKKKKPAKVEFKTSEMPEKSKSNMKIVMLNKPDQNLADLSIGDTQNFKWKSAVKRLLSKAESGMDSKKLHKKVRAAYERQCGEVVSNEFVETKIRKVLSKMTNVEMGDEYIKLLPNA